MVAHATTNALLAGWVLTHGAWHLSDEGQGMPRHQGGRPQTRGPAEYRIPCEPSHMDDTSTPSTDHSGLKTRALLVSVFTIATCGLTPQAQNTGSTFLLMVTGSPNSVRLISSMPIKAGSPK